MNILKYCQKVAENRGYWLSYAIGGSLLLVVALIYQYVFEELPCVVCIQIRLWICLLIFISIFGLLLRKWHWLNIVAQIGLVITAAGLVERSYLLLGTEKGFVFADCGFNAGLPSWFAIEQWLPWIFQVEASCGYTPELLFGVTMAEALMLLSIGLAVMSVGVLAATVIGRKV